MPAIPGKNVPMEELLGDVRRRYLSSPDFNGLHIHGKDVASRRHAAIELVRAGLVQVVSGNDYLNIHIRPWTSTRSQEAQARELKSLRPRDYGVCLYPTAAGMKGVRLPKRLTERPFARAMAKGRGTLELAYFRLDVLEQYRNDARYHFSFGDTGASMTLSDEAFEDPDEPEQDNVYLNHIGFAYDLARYDVDDANSMIVRRVAVFHSDLVKLTPEHQQRWKTYQVPDQGLEPHPAWWNSQMGEWPNGIGPFDRFFVEITAINELTSRAFGTELFASVSRPGEFGWLLRPSQREWDEFITQLDKLLSENLRHSFFDAVGIERQDPRGQTLGSLSRLAIFLERNGASKEDMRLTLSPLREVRKARQGPAHALRKNINDGTFIHRQVSSLHEINQSLIGLRDWFSTHPKNVGWRHPHEGLGDYAM